MFDLPPEEMPVTETLPRATLERCVQKAAADFSFNPNILKAIVVHESGKIGAVNMNTNGTADLGPAQINTIHLGWISQKYPGTTWRDVATRPCFNIRIAGQILSDRLRELPEGSSPWNAVGHYHSKTGKHKLRYLGQVMKVYTRLNRKGDSYGYATVTRETSSE